MSKEPGFMIVGSQQLVWTFWGREAEFVFGSLAALVRM